MTSLAEAEQAIRAAKSEAPMKGHRSERPARK